ncbi:tetratricopeptide repeat protein [Bradyrhizobium japonicum]|uniref:tetratricopeptide repeat protein n=1 Tax=Bradyrhizobium japonicum TaxID=375 RepID=UPI0027147D80|nr:tetratricopeptide repeat protein [Bradyrhizobium japonicum]WLB25263.1 tetratricopeptide repeat protein [Bradyrhizobium japonicum]
MNQFAVDPSAAPPFKPVFFNDGPIEYRSLLKQLHEALSESPKDSSLQYWIGRVQFRLGNFKQARNALTKAREAEWDLAPEERQEIDFWISLVVAGTEGFAAKEAVFLAQEGARPELRQDASIWFAVKWIGAESR